MKLLSFIGLTAGWIGGWLQNFLFIFYFFTTNFIWGGDGDYIAMFWTWDTVKEWKVEVVWSVSQYGEKENGHFLPLFFFFLPGSLTLFMGHKQSIKANLQCFQQWIVTQKFNFFIIFSNKFSVFSKISGIQTHA